MEKYPPNTVKEKSFSELKTIKKAAQIIGIQYRQLLDAVNSNQVPYYRLQKSRRMVRLDEVLDLMKQDQKKEVSHD